MSETREAQGERFKRGWLYADLAFCARIDAELEHYAAKLAKNAFRAAQDAFYDVMLQDAALAREQQPPTTGRCQTCGLEDRRYYEQQIERLKAYEAKEALQSALPPTLPASVEAAKQSVLSLMHWVVADDIPEAIRAHHKRVDALITAVQQPLLNKLTQAERWYRAIDEEGVCQGRAIDIDDPDPKTRLNELIAWNCEVAVNPAVSAAAAALVTSTQQPLLAEIERLKALVEAQSIAPRIAAIFSGADKSQLAEAIRAWDIENERRTAAEDSAADLASELEQVRRACACADPDPVMQADNKFYCYRCSFQTGARPDLLYPEDLLRRADAAERALSALKAEQETRKR